LIQEENDWGQKKPQIADDNSNEDNVHALLGKKIAWIL
jgi:hypothetical protein